MGANKLSIDGASAIADSLMVNQTLIELGWINIRDGKQWAKG